MKKSKKYIVISIVILIILVIILLLIMLINKRKNNAENVYEKPYDPGDYTDNDIRISFNDYYIIKYCFQTYIDTLNTESSNYYTRDENNKYIKFVEDSQIEQKIYNLLSESYINDNKITLDTVYKYVDTTKEKEMAIVTKVQDKTIDESTSVKSFLVEGLQVPITDMNKAKQIYLIVNIDYKNKTFSIMPVSDKELENVKIKKIESIENKGENIYDDETDIVQEDIAKEYFNLYKYIILADSKIAYNYLEEEYKEKRFGSLQSFKEYVNNNKDIFETMRIEKYEIIRNEDNTEYVCTDQYNNIYIFYEKSTLDYNVILDMYTLDIPQLNEKYDEANEKGKCILNIEKVKQALNSGDYKYIYGKLNEQFKNKNYSTLSTFENYMKSNLNKYNKIEYKEFKNEGETYIYNVELTDLLGKTDKTINMQILMQLKDDRDFVMSFSIK